MTGQRGNNHPLVVLHLLHKGRLARRIALEGWRSTQAFVLSNEMNYSTCSAKLCLRLASAHLSPGLALISVARLAALNPPDAKCFKITQHASTNGWH